jgi:hypothetical protein
LSHFLSSLRLALDSTVVGTAGTSGALKLLIPSDVVGSCVKWHRAKQAGVLDDIEWARPTVTLAFILWLD